MLSLDVANGYGFDDNEYDDSVSDEDVGIRWGGVVCVCK